MRKKQGSTPWVPGGKGRPPKTFNGTLPPRESDVRKPKSVPKISDALRELALAAAGEIQRLRQKNLRPS